MTQEEIQNFYDTWHDKVFRRFLVKRPRGMDYQEYIVWDKNMDYLDNTIIRINTNNNEEMEPYYKNGTSEIDTLIFSIFDDEEDDYWYIDLRWCVPIHRQHTKKRQKELNKFNIKVVDL